MKNICKKIREYFYAACFLILSAIMVVIILIINEEG
jgi:hypothetical protein